MFFVRLKNNLITSFFANNFISFFEKNYFQIK